MERINHVKTSFTEFLDTQLQREIFHFWATPQDHEPISFYPQSLSNNGFDYTKKLQLH